MKPDITNKLPEECISYILSFTSPIDVCRSKLVSPVFRSAADSDTIWGKFLPPDCYDIISNSSSSSNQLVASMSKTQLYFHLCNNPVVIDNGTMSFGLDKATGKKCYMLAARRLSIAWSNTPNYWRWRHLPESRFSEVAELRQVWWLDVKGTIETKILSPKTTYVAYLVYKFATPRYGFEKKPVDLHVELEQSDAGRTFRVFLDPSENIPQFSRERGDGWMEVKLGEFFNEHGDDGKAICSLREVDNYIPKKGLIVEGIDIRPKDIR
ncbi:putative F-box protein PP2-B12 isoform X2 [Durio zibethinus]|uniref:F-box protein PP2-B12 isoform X2 n=1 Tax=Durio zibethinus TaxID=66656 RepID=A0A6P5X3R7_DURZI|nr:putative F-box protein PP2-B12 isoform X2 [Durio zibethinus]